MDPINNKPITALPVPSSGPVGFLPETGPKAFQPRDAAEAALAVMADKAGYYIADRVEGGGYGGSAHLLVGAGADATMYFEESTGKTRALFTANVEAGTPTASAGTAPIVAAGYRLVPKGQKPQGSSLDMMEGGFMTMNASTAIGGASVAYSPAALEELGKSGPKTQEIMIAFAGQPPGLGASAAKLAGVKAGASAGAGGSWSWNSTQLQQIASNLASDVKRITFNAQSDALGLMKDTFCGKSSYELGGGGRQPSGVDAFDRLCDDDVRNGIHSE